MKIYKPECIMFLKETEENWCIQYIWTLTDENPKILHIVLNNSTYGNYDLKIIQKILKKEYKHDLLQT